MVVKGKLPGGCQSRLSKTIPLEVVKGWRTYFRSGVGQRVEGGGFAGRGLPHERNQGISPHDCEEEMGGSRK